MNSRYARLSFLWWVATTAMVAACAGCSSNHSGKGESESTTGGTGTCKPGLSGCQCNDGTECEPFAICSGGLCIKQTVSALHISGAVQGCEVLLKEEGSRVLTVQYAEGVAGSFVREPPNIAVSVVAKSDEPLTEGSVKLVLAGSEAKALKVVKFTCVNKAAEKVSDAKVSL